MLQQLAQDFLDHPVRTTEWLLVRLLFVSLLLWLLLFPISPKVSESVALFMDASLAAIVFVYLFRCCVSTRMH
jgi:hypothetical protein